MSTVACCLPAPIPTHRPWHRALRDQLQAHWRAALAGWQRRRRAAACRATFRHLSRHTLEDLGLLDCLAQEPTLPRVDWEFGRWR